LFDALKGTRNGVDNYQVQRFICAHTVMLALQGIPALYIHSLTATPNNYQGVEQSGRTRSINRHKWQYNELLELLNNPTSAHANVFHELKRLLKIRRRQPAFHPNARQETIHINDLQFAFWRISTDQHQRILSINNLSTEIQTLQLPEHPRVNGSAIWRDLIERTDLAAGTQQIKLYPYQSVWLEALD